MQRGPWMRDDDDGPSRRRPVSRSGLNLGWIGLGAAAAIALLAFAFATARVDAGEACAVTRFGAVVREAGPGLHLRLPGIERFHCFRTATTFYEVLDEPGGGSQADFIDEPIDGVTRDGQPVGVTLNLRYRIPGNRVGEIYETIGRTTNEVNERVIKFHTRSITRQQVQKLGATELYAGDLDLAGTAIGDLLRPRFEESGVELEYFELKRPRFNETYEDAIEAQQIAREQIETRENEAAAAEQEAQRVANLARGDAEAEQIRAAGEATAIALRGEAARTNPEIISLNYIEALKTINWAILDGESVTPFLNLQPPGEGSAPGAPGGSAAPAAPTAPEPTPGPEDAESAQSAPQDESEVPPTPAPPPPPPGP